MTLYTFIYFYTASLLIQGYLPSRDVPCHDLREDGDHGSVVKVVDGHGVEVSQESRGDRITTTTCE